MKKQITLMSLMLGIILLVSVSGVSATMPEVTTCQLIIDEPIQGEYYDPVTVSWHWEGDCDPDYYNLQFQPNTCGSGNGWNNLDTDTNHFSSNVFSINNTHSSYEWDNLPASGVYCIRATMENGNDNPDPVVDTTGLWYLDLTAPEVFIDSVSEENEGDCTDGDGVCYVNTATDITLGCEETTESVWQSGIKSISYTINDGPVQTVNGDSATFSFEEDSEHELEYWCKDNVDKVSEHKFKDFIVESQAPVFNDKIVNEPKESGCDVQHPSEEDCDWYVTQDSKICVSAYDPAPHPVGGVEISCMATVWNTLQSEPSNVEIELDEEGCFTYGEDSFHELHCTATDALGNTANLYEADIVDTVAPNTELTYTGPYYNDDEVQWIDGVSKVVLEGVDPQPHPVNGVSTYYRYGIVDDAYCYGTNEGSVSLGETEWNTYSEPFGMEESCHLIEYYSVDALGNTEVVKQEFVFVDKTAPTLNKEVGEPSSNVNKDPIWNWYLHPENNIEWEVTLNTPITISCEDQGNHPSGIGNTEESGIYYRVVLDGKYNQSSWQFVPSDEFEFYFPEQSEHLLEFYCVDNVGKTSGIDSELFKVTGTAFELTIGDKWDLISVPFQLIGDGDVEDVFDNSNIVEVWSYENGEWKVYSPSDGIFDIDQIVPGRGYWVKTTDGTTVTIGGSLMQPATLPPSVELDKGWNLIGHYDLSSRKAYCSLFSLVDTQQGFPRWSALWGYNSAGQTFEPLTQWSYTNPGRGYWVEMDVEDSYSPSSICYGFS